MEIKGDENLKDEMVKGVEEQGDKKTAKQNNMHIIKKKGSFCKKLKQISLKATKKFPSLSSKEKSS